MFTADSELLDIYEVSLLGTLLYNFGTSRSYAICCSFTHSLSWPVYAKPQLYVAN